MPPVLPRHLLPRTRPTPSFPLPRWPCSTSGFFWWKSSSGRPRASCPSHLS